MAPIEIQNKRSVIKAVRKAKKTKTNTMTKGKRQRKTKRVLSSFQRYIYTIHKEVNKGQLKISRSTVAVLNNFCMDIFGRFAVEAANLCKISKKATMTEREIQSAAKMVLSGDISKHAMFGMSKALGKFKSEE